MSQSHQSFQEVVKNTVFTHLKSRYMKSVDANNEFGRSR
jgi:hypothetical protein